MTLEEYFIRNWNKNIIDFSLRISLSIDDEVRFYIHPEGKDGETLDFIVNKNNLIEDRLI